MSNDLIVPGIAGAPSKRFQEHPIAPETIGAGIGAGLGYSVIGTMGKQFQLRYQGDAHILVKPDGDAAQQFDMIILRGGETPSHTWYKQGYDKNNAAPPDCSSTDGIAPDDASPHPQSNLCQVCPQHEWKMQPNGRKGRACADSLRLAVYPVSQNLIEKAIGHRLNEAVLFRVPAASMKDLVEFFKNVRANHGQMASYGYVTRVKMRQDVPHAQFTYQVSAWLTDEQIDQMEQARNEPVAYRILGQSPEGRSLVRMAANNPQLAMAGAAAAAFDLLPVNPVPKQAPPWEEAQVVEEIALPPKQEAKPALQPIEDAPADMDALVAAMRPRPPVQG